MSTLAPRGRNGTWLIDPQDFKIAASGGDISGATLSTNLGNGNVTLQSTAGATAGNGDIFVNDAVSWTQNNTLTLSAQRNIYVNAPINASGSSSGKVALEYGQGALAANNSSNYFVRAAISLPAGGNFSAKLGSDGLTQTYKVITSLTDLQGIEGNLGGSYALGSDIDASVTSTGVRLNGGNGFTPLGHVDSSQSLFIPFTGTFDGLGHAITGLTIRNGNGFQAGLFGYIESSAVVRNVGLLNVSVNAPTASSGGGLVGESRGRVYNVYSTGTVTGSYHAGGLVGVNKEA